MQQWKVLCVDKGVLYRKVLDEKGKQQLVLPTVLHNIVLKDLHEGVM